MFTIIITPIIYFYCCYRFRHSIFWRPGQTLELAQELPLVRHKESRDSNIGSCRNIYAKFKITKSTSLLSTTILVTIVQIIASQVTKQRNGCTTPASPMRGLY